MIDPVEEETQKAINDLYRSSIFRDRQAFQRLRVHQARPRRKEPSAVSHARAKAELARINEELEDPNIIADPNRHKALMTMKLQLEQAMDENFAMSKAQETDDFNQWLLGRGKEQDHIRTPWYRTPLTTLPGAREYVLQFVKDRFKFLEYVHSLQMMGPKDIKEALEYFRFIVRGKEDGKLDYLEEWSRIDSMKQMTRKYGKQVAKRLADWPITRGDVMPADGVKLLATDFRSYIDHHWEPDEEKRRSLFEEDGLREELMVSLASLQNHEEIRVALDEYYNRVEEKDNLLVTNIRSQTALITEISSLQSRFQELPRRLRESPQVIMAYERRKQALNEQLDAVKKRIAELFAKIANDHVKVGRVKDMLLERRAPAAALAVIMGNASEEDLLELVQDEFHAGEDLIDQVQILAADLRQADTMLSGAGWGFLFRNPDGTPDLDKIDEYKQLLSEIDVTLVRLQTSQQNRMG